MMMVVVMMMMVVIIEVGWATGTMGLGLGV